MNIEDLISQYLDGELSDDAEAELHHRLAVSPEDRKLFRTHVALRSVARDQRVVAQPAPALRTSLFERLQREEGMAAEAARSSTQSSLGAGGTAGTALSGSEAANGAAPPDMMRKQYRKPQDAPPVPQQRQERVRRRRVAAFLLPFAVGILMTGALWFGLNQWNMNDGSGPLADAASFQASPEAPAGISEENATTESGSAANAPLADGYYMSVERESTSDNRAGRSEQSRRSQTETHARRDVGEEPLIASADIAASESDDGGAPTTPATLQGSATTSGGNGFSIRSGRSAETSIRTDGVEVADQIIANRAAPPPMGGPETDLMYAAPTEQAEESSTNDVRTFSNGDYETEGSVTNTALLLEVNDTANVLDIGNNRSGQTRRLVLQRGEVRDAETNQLLGIVQEPLWSLPIPVEDTGSTDILSSTAPSGQASIVEAMRNNLFNNNGLLQTGSTREKGDLALATSPELSGETVQSTGYRQSSMDKEKKSSAALLRSTSDSTVQVAPHITQSSGSGRVQTTSVSMDAPLDPARRSPSPSLLLGARQSGLSDLNGGLFPQTDLQFGLELWGAHQIYGVIGYVGYRELRTVVDMVAQSPVPVDAFQGESYEVWGGGGYRYRIQLSKHWDLGGGMWGGLGKHHTQFGIDLPVGYRIGDYGRVFWTPLVALFMKTGEETNETASQGGITRRETVGPDDTHRFRLGFGIGLVLQFP